MLFRSRNRLDAVVPFASLPPEVIVKVVEKFIFQLEAQLADRGVQIEMNDAATAWLAERGYDEKFGARPLARLIQEKIKKPLAEELLFGKLEHGGIVKVLVTGKGADSTLGFEYIPMDPAKKPRNPEEDDDDEGPVPVLAEASPKKALPGPKEKSDRPSKSGGGAVPSVPRRKKDE